MEDCGLPRPLSAKYKEDFAYPTIKDRMPIILTQVIDRLHRMHTDIKEKYGETAAEELKEVTGKLSKLKNEVQTNKVIVPLSDGLSDVQLWSDFIAKDQQVQGGDSKWFVSPWLFTECYFYRRIWEAVQMSPQLKHLDHFAQQKQNAVTTSEPAIKALASFLRETTGECWEKGSSGLELLVREFMEIALWGNKCDLSISAGIENSQKTDPIGQLSELKAKILVDDFAKVWQHLMRELPGKPQGLQIHIVLDNAGFELLTDLALAEFLIHQGIAERVTMHGKKMPWFVSDVTKEDFMWTLQELARNKDNHVAARGKAWQKRLIDGSWVYTSHDFWTLPHDFSAMKSTSPDLYGQLSEADLIIFKGDLNYRKLVGDLKWPMTTDFDSALRGFHPAPLVSLRTLKCDLVVGLKEGQAEATHAQDEEWLVTGAWAVIQASQQRC